MSRRRSILLVLGGAAAVLGAIGLGQVAGRLPGLGSAPTAASAPTVVIHERDVLSQVYAVDRIYKSMTGPSSLVEVALDDTPGLLWITGFEATMVAADGATPESQEFMCHSNLDFDASLHGSLLDAAKSVSGRVFTLSQGQHRIDLPDGFGIPLLASETLKLDTQVLNLNMTEGRKDVRHRVVMRYARDRELAAPLRPLFVTAAYGLKLLEGKDGYFGVQDAPTEHQHGASCLPGQGASPSDYTDRHGRKFTGHWRVKPGREVNHTLVTQIMGLPYDTTLHYVAVHLHPFAETLELRDRTADRTIYKASARQVDAGVGLAHVDAFSSEEGIALYRDHEYELISVYDNTTDEEQDSMAVMNLYLLDKDFERERVDAGR